MQMIHDGQGDATLATWLTGTSLAYIQNYDLVSTEIEVPNYTVFYSMGVQQGQRQLLNRLNEGLAILHRTGRFESIYRQWFGRFTPTSFSTVQILLAVSSGLAVALLVAIAAAVYQRRLRRDLAQAHTAQSPSPLCISWKFSTPIPSH